MKGNAPENPDCSHRTQVDDIDKLEEQLSEVENKILRAEYDVNTDVELPLTEEEKGEWRQNQKANGERANKHMLNQHYFKEDN